MQAPAITVRSMIGLDIGLLLIRLMLAAVFLLHGSQKLFGVLDGPGIDGFTAALERMNVPMPRVSAWLAALSEFVGGIVLVAGTGVRVAGFFLFFTMMVAFFKGHGAVFDSQKGGGEFALTLGIVSLGLIFTGPGQLTVGMLLGNDRRKT